MSQRRRKQARKPKILQDKLRLACAIRDNWTVIEYQKAIHGYYWSGVFQSKKDGRRISIFVQFYVKRQGIDFVNLHWEDKYYKL